MLKYIQITNKNLEFATNIQMKILMKINSIWLGWFGVLNEFRRKGYGQQILIDTINMAKDLAKKYPIKYFRLYTSEKDDSIAQPLYYKIMDINGYKRIL